MNVDSIHACKIRLETGCDCECLQLSVFGDICKACTLDLSRLERALMFLQLDDSQTTVIWETNLIQRLLERCEDHKDVEESCRALRCLSLLMENLFRNAIFDFEDTIVKLELGYWCVKKLEMSSNSFVVSEVFNMTASVVKLSKHERDLVVSEFILHHIHLLSVYPSEMLKIIRNSALHECNSENMMHLLHETLTATLSFSSVLDNPCTYELLLQVVNNYLFDNRENIYICCLQFEFDKIVWNKISRTRVVTEREAEFLSSFANFNLCSALNWLALCRKLVNEDNCTLLLSVLLEVTEKCFPDQEDSTELNDLQCLYMEVLKDLWHSSTSLIPFMRFHQKEALQLLIGWMI